MKEFARHLKRLRQEKGFTRYRLAQLSGVTAVAIGKLEGQGANPTLSTLIKLGKGLGVAVTELLAEAVAKQTKGQGEGA